MQIQVEQQLTASLNTDINSARRIAGSIEN